MNANVFERGDFLYDTEHCRLIEIKSISDDLLTFNVKPIDSEKIYIQFESNLKPVELNESFLLDNGFYVSWQTQRPLNPRLDHMGFYHANMDFSLIYGDEEGYGVEISRNVIRFQYVHELQHLMRFVIGRDMEFSIKHGL